MKVIGALHHSVQQTVQPTFRTVALHMQEPIAVWFPADAGDDFLGLLPETQRGLLGRAGEGAADVSACLREQAGQAGVIEFQVRDEDMEHAHHGSAGCLVGPGRGNLVAEGPAQFPFGVQCPELSGVARVLDPGPGGELDDSGHGPGRGEHAPGRDPEGGLHERGQGVEVSGLFLFPCPADRVRVVGKKAMQELYVDVRNRHDCLPWLSASAEQAVGVLTRFLEELV
jgi:hypothetical protein